MLIGGLERISLIDYPRCISAIVFTKGCNFRCSFCYNPMLVCPLGRIENTPEMGGEGRSHQTKDNFSLISEDDLFQFLKSRAGKLDAVVITGGEPTMQKDLLEFAGKIKKMGFLVKLDTNGTNPEIIKDLISKKLIDYIAMDLKSDEKHYEETANVKISFEKIEKSVKIIKGSDTPHEFRTTCVPGLIDEKIIENMAKIIEGADKWYLQKFKSDTELINKDLIGKASFSDKEMNVFVEIGKKYVKVCDKRG